MSRRTRQAVLAIHLSVSVGWIGAVVAYLALATAAATTSESQVIRSSWIGMELVGWYAVTPLAAASLITGVVMAAATPWGILNQYWVVISLVLTAVAFVVLILHMPDVTATADVAQNATDERIQTLGSDLAHPAIGLLVLLTVQVLNIYKPRGLTRIGQRRRDRFLDAK